MFFIKIQDRVVFCSCFVTVVEWFQEMQPQALLTIRNKWSSYAQK